MKKVKIANILNIISIVLFIGWIIFGAVFFEQLKESYRTLEAIEVPPEDIKLFLVVFGVIFILSGISGLIFLLNLIGILLICIDKKESGSKALMFRLISGMVIPGMVFSIFLAML